jgi:hypothetical protein
MVVINLTKNGREKVYHMGEEVGGSSFNPPASSLRRAWLVLYQFLTRQDKGIKEMKKRRPFWRYTIYIAMD